MLPAGELAIGGFGGSRCTFAADAEGYKYIVWVFNARFAISSPELCQPPSFVKKESLGTAACYHSAQKKSCSYEKLAIEHAVASAAQRLRSNSHCTLPFGSQLGNNWLPVTVERKACSKSCRLLRSYTSIAKFTFL